MSESHKYLFVVVLITTASAMSGCGSRKIFSAQFDKQPVNDALVPQADVGFFREGPFGGVSIVPAPDAGDIANWVEIQPNAGGWGELDGFFSKSPPNDGHYLFSARLYIPSGSRASISFAGGGVSEGGFLNLDFPKIGIELTIPGAGGGAAVCCFPRDQVFTLTVDFTVGPTSKATVSLLGAAQGSFDVPLSGSVNDEPRISFGSVIFLTDSGGGPFFVNDITVLYSS